MPPSPTYQEKVWHLTLTSDLLTQISMGNAYSSRTIFLPSLKLLGQSILELSVAQSVGDQHNLWPWPTDLDINRDHLLIKDYVPTKFEASRAKRSWIISCTRCGRPRWPLTLTLDLNSNRDYLLIMDYIPTKFEASWAKPSWVISCTRLRGIDIRPTDRQTDMCKAIPVCPSFFERGGGHKNVSVRG